MVTAACSPGHKLLLALELRPAIVAEVGWGAYKDRHVYNHTIDEGGCSLALMTFHSMLDDFPRWAHDVSLHVCR